MGKGSWISGLLGLLLITLVGTAAAQPGPGGCPGWGTGPGMGYGPGYGMGPGMGPGMGGMGPGMGYGMGYGMGPGMGGMGPGYGYGYGYGLAGLNLTADQQKTINKLLDDHRKQHFEFASKLADQQARLRDEYLKEKWNADAITKIYDQMADVRRQMIRSRIELRNQIYDRLTPEQRQQFRSTWVE